VNNWKKVSKTRVFGTEEQALHARQRMLRKENSIRPFSQQPMGREKRGAPPAEREV